MKRERFFRVFVGEQHFVSVPWDLMAPHDEQAKINHSQTLEEMYERGDRLSCASLDPSEAVALLQDRPWMKMDDDAALFELYSRLAYHYRERYNDSFGILPVPPDCTHAPKCANALQHQLTKDQSK